ncbi:MAG: class I SAM-dependent methyltransferase [Chloroflexi bacterium]|nr:class I SAM-dependent methyltransferase [Chloroflexota bacterium]
MKTAPKPSEAIGAVNVAVSADPSDDPALLRTAARLAADLGLPFLERPVDQGYEMLLVAAPGSLELRVIAGDAALRGGRAVSVDLEALDTKSGSGRTLRQPIAKAVGLRGKKESPVTVIDATAGWGKDTWLLASLGCRVLAVERSAVVATLLRDGLVRAGAQRPETLERVRLVTADSRHLLRQIAQVEPAALPNEARAFSKPDVVYLDPMFAGAERRKTAEKKAMRVLRRLVGSDEDAGELFAWAMRAAVKRVVVKRPAKGGLDFGAKPVATHRGKGFCFDVYVPRTTKVK